MNIKRLNRPVLLSIILFLLVLVDVFSTWYFVVFLGSFEESNPLGFNVFTVSVSLIASSVLVWASTKIGRDDNIFSSIDDNIFSLAVGIVILWRLYIILSNFFMLAHL